MVYVNNASFCSWFPAVLKVRAIQEPSVAQIPNYYIENYRESTPIVKLEFGVSEHHTDFAILKLYNCSIIVL